MIKPVTTHKSLGTLHEPTPQTFIFERKSSSSGELCKEIIKKFESAKDKQYIERTGQTGQTMRAIKRSTDLFISGKKHWQAIDRQLFLSLADSLREFREAFPYFKGKFKDMGYGIQRALPGEYYHWHIDGGSHDFSMRQLVAIWYLNDIPGRGGETEFLVRQVRIKPEQGKRVLFPPFWTHEHRGAVLKKSVKYIATTWVVFA